ncbi:MAG: squalene synthase HpnC [Gluconacetobacter diazotrophicus]|nr:squalene synthase HpnC [Gluconacetobacter diazotrophicus]
MSDAVVGDPERDVSSGKNKTDENFPVGSLLIARRLRPHVHAYYDFARAVDDIADNAVLSPEEKVVRLDAMEDVLLGRAPGTERAEMRSAVRLRQSNRDTGIAPERGTDLLVAFRQDAVKGRYADWEELSEYCRYSANPVGRFLLDLHGEGETTHAPSDALCTALQVLNHLQDLKADRQVLDRCYLPGNWLAQHGETADSVLRDRCSGGLWAVIERCLDEVDRLNRVAETLPRRIRDRRMRLEAAVIVGLARRLARRLRREDPLAGRVKLTRTDAVGSLLAAARVLP